MLLCAAAAGAAPVDDRQTCARASADVAIAACTRAIASRRYSGSNLAKIYKNRGNAYYDKKDYDRAIADYSEVIRLDPKYALAFYNRGLAYYDKGDLDRAIADSSEAIRLDPKHALAFYNRGIAYDAKGGVDRAIADYNEAIRLDPKLDLAFASRGYAYFSLGDFTSSASDLLRANELNYIYKASAMLWRYLAREHLAQDGAAELSANAARLKNKDWPYPVIDFYLGRRSQDAMRTAAGKPDEKCEAAFYAGEWQLLRGDKTQAKATLQIAADTCPKDFREYYGAVSELKRINTAATAAPHAPPTAPDPVADCAQAEADWKSAETLGIVAAYEDHLKRFPNCEFAVLARAKIEALKK